MSKRIKEASMKGSLLNNNDTNNTTSRTNRTDPTDYIAPVEQVTNNKMTIRENGKHLDSLKSSSDCDLKVNSAKKLKDDDHLNNSVKVSDIIGDFGPYQITVVIFAALRAMSCALDGLSGPFVSPSIKNFQCELCTQPLLEPLAFMSNGTCNVNYNRDIYQLDPTRCYFQNANSSITPTSSLLIHHKRFYCDKWNYNYMENERLMNSLTIEQNLICDREWLKSLSNSLYFVGATFGLLFWGIISDRYGRRTAYICSHFVTLIFGFGALFANSMTTYVILRSINAFGMIGELIPRSILVEMVATKYRFVCSVICQIGWATGIILVPILSYINPGYRFILGFPVMLSLIMLPWLIWLPESARWLIINNKYELAKKELVRAARINNHLTDDIDLKIEQYNRQVVQEEIGSDGSQETIVVAKKRIGVCQSILAIFTNMVLLKDTLSVFTLLFVAEVVYFSLTLNVADLSGSLYINYIISGVSELFSIACCGFMLAKFSRRKCLFLLLLLSTISYLLMALVNVYEQYLPMSTILLINAFGKLTAIGNLMVIILVSQEVFPTVIRQFGTSLCITVGKLGSAAAPFTHELGQIIGQSYCFAMFSLICFGCAFIPFLLSETGNVELPDTVVDVEASDRSRKKDKRRKKMFDSEKSYNGHDEDDHDDHDNGKHQGSKSKGKNYANGIADRDILTISAGNKKQRETVITMNDDDNDGGKPNDLLKEKYAKLELNGQPKYLREPDNDAVANKIEMLQQEQQQDMNNNDSNEVDRNLHDNHPKVLVEPISSKQAPMVAEKQVEKRDGYLEVRI